jgi:hypothetical protein
VVAINVGRTQGDWRLVEALASTLKAEFPSVYLIDTGDAGYDVINVLVVATKQPTRLENLAANAELLASSGSEMGQLLQGVIAGVEDRVREFTEPTLVLTDDKAPVEQIVHGLILSYLAGR